MDQTHPDFEEQHEKGKNFQCLVALIRLSGCRLQFGGAENGLLAIALQNSSTIFRHAVREIQGASLQQNFVDSTAFHRYTATGGIWWKATGGIT
jgi:hypothetical protein